MRIKSRIVYRSLVCFYFFFFFCSFFFFFKQKTAYEIKECDWSSDVCSSDLDVNFYNFWRIDLVIIDKIPKEVRKDN